MAMRRALGFVFVGIVASMGAQYPTPNFTVEAPTQEIAKKIGQYAEYYRKEKATLWLGREMPRWPEPCPIQVDVTMNGAGGATSFAFDHGQVLGQTMHIEGSLDRLVNSVLPHEITHTVFAYYFRCPVPRWADEGGSVLSEDEPERSRHDRMVRDKLNAGRAIPLRRLLPLTDYPRDMENVMSLYAEGFSVCDFLVNSSSRPEFLKFVADGMRYGWDESVKAHYQYENVNGLEEAWLAQLRKTKKQRGTVLASSTEGAPAEGEPTGRLVERKSAPPTQPFVDKPVIRGQAEESRPGYLPEPGPEDRVQTQSRQISPGIKLLPPESDPLRGTPAGRPIPSSSSPIGYPR
ncbi:MAG TPA: hypothetical protein VGG61_03300 [Gemmataceae bacterium]